MITKKKKNEAHVAGYDDNKQNIPPIESSERSHVIASHLADVWHTQLSAPSLDNTHNT